jgi:predicted DNA-binding protein (MmcQ/YjbR family)
MKFEKLQKYLLGKNGSTEDTPFGPDALVFKVMDKMFALVAWNKNPLKITLKCDPDSALNLREQYPAIQPGYYMNKKHWNTITLDGSISEKEISEMINDSYNLVFSKLKKSDRLKLGQPQ